MKTLQELNDNILKITELIRESYPELSKFISEMPVKNSEPIDEAITRKDLSDYYVSLENLLKNYSVNHDGHHI